MCNRFISQEDHRMQRLCYQIRYRFRKMKPYYANVSILWYVVFLVWTLNENETPAHRANPVNQSDALYQIHPENVPSAIGIAEARHLSAVFIASEAVETRTDAKRKRILPGQIIKHDKDHQNQQKRKSYLLKRDLHFV